jgi:hypothetical protein
VGRGTTLKVRVVKRAVEIREERRCYIVTLLVLKME